MGSRECIQGGALLAYTLVCVDVALAVGAGVRHILQVINQTRDQAAAQITAVRQRGGETSIYEPAISTMDSFIRKKNPNRFGVPVVASTLTAITSAKISARSSISAASISSSGVWEREMGYAKRKWAKT